MSTMPSSAKADIEAYKHASSEWNFNAGAFTAENQDTKLVLGTRLMRHYAHGLGWGGNFSWVPLDGENLLLFSGELDYTFPIGQHWGFFLGAGVGGASVAGETDLHVPLAAGLKLFPGNDPSWALRADVRDNVIFGQETTHNWEFSAGVSWLF